MHVTTHQDKDKRYTDIQALVQNRRATVDEAMELIRGESVHQDLHLAWGIYKQNQEIYQAEIPRFQALRKDLDIMLNLGLLAKDPLDKLVEKNYVEAIVEKYRRVKYSDPVQASYLLAQAKEISLPYVQTFVDTTNFLAATRINYSWNILLLGLQAESNQEFPLSMRHSRAKEYYNILASIYDARGNFYLGLLELKNNAIQNGLGYLKRSAAQGNPVAWLIIGKMFSVKAEAQICLRYATDCFKIASHRHVLEASVCYELFTTGTVKLETIQASLQRKNNAYINTRPRYALTIDRLLTEQQKLQNLYRAIKTKEQALNSAIKREHPQSSTRRQKQKTRL